MNDKTDDKYYIPNDNDVGTVVSDVLVCASKVVFEKNGFVIFYCGNFSVKGNFRGSVVPGLNYKVSGTVGLYGRVLQITASSIEHVKDDDSKDMIIASFLSSHFDGIGEKTGLAIARRFGMDFLEELLKRPQSTAKAINGLSERRALQASEKIGENRDLFEVLLKLRVLGLSDDKASKAFDMFGITAAEEIRQNPYKLLRIEGVGFETCEYLAEGLDIDLFDPMRILGATLYVLNEIHYTSGNTYIRPQELEKAVRSLVFAPDRNVCGQCDKAVTCDRNISLCQKFPEAYIRALTLGVKLSDIVIYKFEGGKCKGCAVNEAESRIALKRIFKTEASLKSEIEAFVAAKKPCEEEDKARVIISGYAKTRKIELDERQEAALIMAMHEPFSIITGGPGTGKTTITGILAEHFKQNRISSVFCAPTGRAAKRLSEAVGIEANTIHRLLEVRPNGSEEGFAFGRNYENPLEARVIVIDEASMVDNGLFLALLRAVKKDSSIIVIGDPNQLPSVGPGNLLADLLSCRSIPRVELKYVFRQADESSIAANAYRILAGEALIGNNTDFEILKMRNEEEALNKLFELYEQNKDEDMAILAPTKQNVMGTTSLNREIQSIAMKPGAESLAVNTSAFYREYDRVMQIKNDYNIEYFDAFKNETGTGVYNGEIGVISQINELEKSIDVIFDDGKKVSYSGKTLEDIDLAYAMTVHKAQGCEFDTIILALGRMSPKLISRKILYTAVTRGKRKVIIVDCADVLNRMLRTQDTNVRATSLGDFLAIVDSKYL